MTISVLLSVYKSENPSYLDRALRSVWIDQTLKPDEIVLIEDGPLGDELLDVIQKWKDLLSDKLLVLRNEQNLGLTKSLNKGIQYIKSDLIARMDSDDISEPSRFEKQVAYLEEHPEVDVVGGSLQEFNEGNDCLNIRHYPQTPEESRKYIVKASPLAHPTVMIRRRVFDTGIRYNEKYRTCQDVALWFKLISKGYKIANIPDITIRFRRDDAVFSRRKSKKNIWNEFRIYIQGIYSLQGLFTWKYIYPMSRLIFRLMPASVIKWIYGSKLRKGLLQ